MRTVLLNPSGSQCRNLGDLAMLQVAVARWRTIWPSARIAVMTEEPDLLTAIVRQVIPVEIRGQAIWLGTHLLGRLHRQLGPRTAARLESREREMKMQAARSLEAALSIKYRVAGRDPSVVGAFLHWLRRADVVAVPGGGTIADPFPDRAAEMLDTLSLAATLGDRGGPPATAIFGHGFGPLEDPALRAKASGILNRIDFIGIREDRLGRGLLQELGVHDERIHVTGDEAIELAFDERQSEIGRALGVNIRIAHYANLDVQMLDVVRRAISSATRRYSTPAVALPISKQTDRTGAQTTMPDAVAISGLLAGVTEMSDDPYLPDMPVAAIRAIARCRVVVTGSYHAAVFALAQGIPAIGLFASTYYRAKFVGLAGQFGAGPILVDMTQRGWADQLAMAIDTAWHSAESVRPQLLTAAMRQIERSRRAYRTVAAIADARIAAAPASRR
jgi:polysaccharide pyruvyl transferase WcaK-like protein